MSFKNKPYAGPCASRSSLDMSQASHRGANGAKQRLPAHPMPVLNNVSVPYQSCDQCSSILVAGYAGVRAAKFAPYATPHMISKSKHGNQTNQTCLPSGISNAQTRPGSSAGFWLATSFRNSAKFWIYCIPKASLYISKTASSSAMSSGSRLRRAITLRITLVS